MQYKPNIYVHLSVIKCSKYQIDVNGSQLATLINYIPYMSLPWSLYMKLVKKGSNYQCIRCNIKIRIKIFVLWFHGRCHIEQVDVRLLNRTQNGNDVSTWNLVQMLRRHRYTTLFSWTFEFLFQIWITVKSSLIGQFMVAMATNSKRWRHDYVCYVTKYLCPKYDIDRLFNF